MREEACWRSYERGCAGSSSVQIHFNKKKITLHIMLPLRTLKEELFKDLGAAGKTVLPLSILLNLDNWTKIKKLIEYLYSI